MVNDVAIADLILPLILPLLVGFVLGLFFFGGLWWTVQRLPTSQYPGPLALGSMMLRLGTTVIIFYLVMDGQWERLLACTVGFLVARTLLVRRVQPQKG